ncbi:MAG: transglutaminase-like cysteine peptidase [Azovibrio sp.]
MTEKLFRIGTCLILVIMNGFVLALDFAKLENTLLSRFGPARVVLLKEWKQLLDSNKSLSNQEKLYNINSFFNKNISFDSDQSIWNQSDYWATPLETIGQGRGDCEDFAIAKYYSLLASGVPKKQLRLIYVKAQQGASSQAHMVLAYYPSPNAVPLILDNLDPEIKPANQRKDLTPIFSFNSEGIWHGTGNKTGNNRFSRWHDLQMRARAEGHP